VFSRKEQVAAATAATGWGLGVAHWGVGRQLGRSVQSKEERSCGDGGRAG
jgi:hypothetical protein